MKTINQIIGGAQALLNISQQFRFQNENQCQLLPQKAILGDTSGQGVIYEAQLSKVEREALFLRSKNAPKIKKVLLKLCQIRNFSEIGIAETAVAIPISKRKSASTFTAKGNFRRHKRSRRNLRSVTKQILAESAVFTEQKCTQNQKSATKTIPNSEFFRNRNRKDRNASP